jgi:hypothetical protein
MIWSGQKGIMIWIYNNDNSRFDTRYISSYEDSLHGEMSLLPYTETALPPFVLFIVVVMTDFLCPFIVIFSGVFWIACMK